MKRFEQRRTDTTALSAGGHSSCHRLREGNGQVNKQRYNPKSASNSCFWIGDSTGEDVLTGELRQRLSQAATGTPIKKLLAEEMSREKDPKRKSPSIIARLMGLDGLPTPQYTHKQQKRSSGKNCTSQIVSAVKTERNQVSHSCRSSRKSSKEEQEFKDVFEVVDASKMERSASYSSHRAPTFKLSEAEMSFIQQKFMDAKRLSADENLHNSKEFYDAIEELDSNKDLLLKFLHQPDSLFTKHIHDLQSAPPSSRCSHAHLSTVKSFHPRQRESGARTCKIERETPQKSCKRAFGGLSSEPCSKQATHNPVDSSKVQLEVPAHSSILPTRIVVLKPNLGKLHNPSRAISSPRSSHDYRGHSRLSSTQSRDAELRGKKKLTEDAGPLQYKARESRAIAKEITKQMRDSFSGSGKHSSGFRGYAGDESSSNMSETESANESDVTDAVSTWSDWHRASPSCSAESSVSREARNRLSERWRRTHKSVDMGVITRGSTLGEMLTIPEREVMPAKSDGKMGRQVLNDKFDVSYGTAGWVEPLGISSRDGCKYGYINNFSRSRSVPASSSLRGSPKAGACSEILRNDRYLMPKDVMKQDKNKAVKGHFNHREAFSFRNSNSPSKKPYSGPAVSSPENRLCQENLQSNMTENDPCEQNCTVSPISATAITGTSFLPGSVVDMEIESISTPTSSADRKLFSQDYSCARDLQVLSSEETSNGPPEKGAACMQGSVADLESSVSCKESDQPSPVSVLETSFPDDQSSGSECFESLSADLHGLRMQLQLLKLESEAADAEGPMLISSDEDVEQNSFGFSEDRATTPETREFSYMVNVLQDSGINSADPDNFLATWHCSECPINPLTFEELEKRYCDQASWPRSERKLLFDRINLALVVIYQEFSYPHPWVRTGNTICHRWMKTAIEDYLQKLLVSQDKNAKAASAAEKALATELRWLDLGDEIDVIGREIEREITEALVQEIIAL